MRSTFLFFVILLTILTFSSVAQASGQPNWIGLSGSATPSGPSAEVLTSNGSETVIRFTVPGFFLDEIDHANIAYHLLELPGCAVTLDVGKPELPVISELVGIPGNTDIRLSVVDYSETVLTGYNVYPFQTPLRENEKRAGFDIDRATYSANAMYPSGVASAGVPAVWRDLRVVDLEVTPFRFNPVSGELRVCTEITVKLEYSGTNTTNVKSALRRPVAANYDRMYRSNVLNYDQLDLELQTSIPSLDQTAYDYLIIAADGYLDNMTPFVNWKNSQGLVTNVVPISQVGAQFGDIKDFITNEYVTNGIRYVLLVGNEDDIPGYKGYGFFSDYYYSLLEGDDDYADIAIGRFCVSTSEHVDNMVNKSITFESNPPAGDWLGRSLLVANRELAPDKYQGCKEEVRTASETQSGTYSVFFPDFTTAYGAPIDSGGDGASNADVVAYFNDGYRLVNYRGHGEQETWQYWNVYDEYFEIEDVDAIDNGQMTPVVFSIACLNADLSYRRTTIAEAFTQGDDAAVAYLGASDPSYTIPNHDYDKQLYATVFDEGTNAVGDASNEASVRVIQLWGSYGITNARMYLWLGDPSLQLIYQLAPPPAAPVLVSPEDGAEFDDPVQPTLDWEDVTGAISYQVQLDTEDGFYTPVVDQEGVTVSEFTTPQLAGGIYYWRVRAKDGMRYGDWSEIRYFNVGVATQAPLLESPDDGSRQRGTPTLSLRWYEVAGVSEYLVEVDNNSDFTSPERSAQANMCSEGICFWQILPQLNPATYYWRVRVAQDNWPWSEVWSFRLLGREKDDFLTSTLGLPGEVVLGANYPNPFNPTTEISFSLPTAGYVKLELFNIKGRKISTLVDATMGAGYHTVTWNGADAASGVYLYRLETEQQSITKKMLLIK